VIFGYWGPSSSQLFQMKIKAKRLPILMPTNEQQAKTMNNESEMIHLTLHEFLCLETSKHLLKWSCGQEPFFW
jgi:hypothetical protein